MDKEKDVWLLKLFLTLAAIDSVLTAFAMSAGYKETNKLTVTLFLGLGTLGIMLKCLATFAVVLILFTLIERHFPESVAYHMNVILLKIGVCVWGLTVASNLIILIF